jgi:hypothetical protein
VPGCSALRPAADHYGMCPPHLWDDRHDAYFAQIEATMASARRSARDAASAPRERGASRTPHTKIASCRTKSSGG